jgi:hypothetical protein
VAVTTVLGFNGKLYRNTGTYGSPTWNEVPNVKDLSVSIEKGEADASTRESSWKQVRGSLKDATIEFGMVYDTGDVDWTALRDAFLNSTPVELAIADGAIATNGTQYLRVSVEVMKFSTTQALAEVFTTDVSCKPTRADNAPAFVTVSA